MQNRFRGVFITEKKYKAVTIINVNTEKYNNDAAYSKTIDAALQSKMK